jgi:putative transposase
MVGPPGARDRISKGGAEKRTTAERRDYIRHCRPRGLSIAQGCRLIGIPRSIFYDAPAIATDDGEILAKINSICDEFETYGYRGVGAALRHQGVIVNSKKVRRQMREHGLQPKRRRRFVITTDSDHGGPIFPNLASNMALDGPNQLWVADLTYIMIATGFVYLAAILDAWSRRVVGYAISRSIDARLAVAALKAAIPARHPTRGCIHHSDRGSQYASEIYRALLAEHGLLGSMGRRGQSLRQCNSRELYEDAEGRGRLPDGIRDVRGRHRGSSALHRGGLQHSDAPLRARIPQPGAVRGSSRPAAGQTRSLNAVHRQGRTPFGRSRR